MNRPDDRPTPDLDRRLAELLTDAVADVEPTDALTALRARTRRTSSRRWVLASGGAALAAAAVVTAVALGGGSPVATPDGQEPAPPGPTVEPPTKSPVHVAAGYYLGETPAGVRLYREFRTMATTEPLSAAVELLVTEPQDPDYRTPWQPGQLVSAGVDDDVIWVMADVSVRERPPDMSEAEAEAALQQVVRTLQAAVQQRAPVEFRSRDDVLDQVLGIPTPEPVPAAPATQTLSLVNLSDPSEGQVVDGDTLAVRGVANSFEANVLWVIHPAQDDMIVSSGNFTALGYIEKRLFPFSGEIDVSSLDPGTYTLIVETDEPSGGAEGGLGVFTDTRTIVID